MISIIINGKSFFFKLHLSILEACKFIGIKIPRFCYHETLSISGNCRMCLVEITTSLKPIVSCSTEILSNMIIFTNSPFILKARENILEMLLLHHPLDCPICDQAGECDLQDQAIFYGSSFSRNFINKRSIEKKNCGPFIKTIMTRCIHCTRCIRFGEELCGIKFFGSLNRGKVSEIGNYLIKLSLSEISGNVIDLCPVGALTLKSIPFQIRPWEIFSIESIDLTDSLGSNIYLTYRNTNIFRVIPKKNYLINSSWISNRARFYYNLSSFLLPHIYLQKYKFFDFNKLSNLKFPLLFLFNSDLDLQFYYNLKILFKNNNFNNLKIFSSYLLPKNLYFWGNKNKLLDLKFIKNSICFLISIDLKLELPLLNTRLRSKIIHNNFLSFGLNIFFKSNFPIQFLRFSIYDTFFLFLGKQIFCLNFLKKKILIFSNKNLLNRLDYSLLLLLKNKLNILLYIPSLFSNSESLNIINFKSLNLKELNFSKFVFGLALDDNYFIRKLLSKITNFLWVNQFYSDILTFLPKNSWFYIEINQIPGYFLNFEQKIQKFNLLNTNSKSSLKNFIFFIKNNIIKLQKNFYNIFYINKLIKFFYYFIFNKNIKILFFQYLFESFLDPYKFYLKNILNMNFVSFSFIYFYNSLALKVIIEDSNRTSLHLKNASLIIKNSQLIRLTDYSFYS